jgi:DNA polymerase I-like protein with 3'-5' exonuclease and polymerase domains
MSKLAMRKVFDNQELKDLDFHILLQIHDELIGECPIENADKVAEVLTSVMKDSAKPVV